MEMGSIGLISAFVGGLFSFFSPCTLPLLPSLITFFENEPNEKQGKMNKGKLVAFWLGFTFVFIAMGSIASAVGEIFYTYKEWVVKVSGIFVVFMGLFMLGMGSKSRLQQEYRPLLSGHFSGIGGAFLFGIAFTAGWTPCSGPILTSILLVAGDTGDSLTGMMLLAAYAIGFGLPFGLLTLFFDQLFHRVRGIFPYLPQIQRISGILLIGLGIAIYMDKLGAWILKMAY